MPVYEYLCLSCGKKLEEMQSIYDEKLTTCACGGKLKRLISGANSEVEYLSGKEFYEKEIKPDAKRIAERIKNGDENAAADIFGED